MKSSEETDKQDTRPNRKQDSLHLGRISGFAAVTTIQKTLHDRTRALYRSIHRLNRLILSNVFPVPGFVEVGTEAEAVGVVDQPPINGRVDLDGAV